MTPDLTEEEHAQLVALERREGAARAREVLGLSRIVLLDAMARKTMERR